MRRNIANNIAMHGIVLFDLDDTLVDRTGTFRRWAEAFVEAHHLTSRAVDWLCAEDRRGAATRSSLFSAARRELGLAHGVEDLIARYRAEYPTFYSPAREVNAALVALRTAGWKIGVVTNGPPSQVHKLERSALLPLIDAWCISDDLGCEKPDATLFIEAIRRCGGGLDMSPIWMVGDDPLRDIYGASQIGCRTVWIRRGRTWSEGFPVPDFEVDSVPEAVSLIIAPGSTQD